MTVYEPLKYIEEDLKFSRKQLHWRLVESEKYATISVRQTKTKLNSLGRDH